MTSTDPHVSGRHRAHPLDALTAIWLAGGIGVILAMLVAVWL